MQITGTLVNYYFHCKRQCYLHGNKLNLEDNSENVKIGKVIHEKELQGKNSEILIDSIKIDKLTKEYLTEVKKSDADIDAASWQLLYYLKVLKEKGIERKGKLEFYEKKKSEKKTWILELTPEKEQLLNQYLQEIETLILSNQIPDRLDKTSCKKCSYFEYCYI